MRAPQFTETLFFICFSYEYMNNLPSKVVYFRKIVEICLNKPKNANPFWKYCYSTMSPGVGQSIICGGNFKVMYLTNLIPGKDSSRQVLFCVCSVYDSSSYYQKCQKSSIFDVIFSKMQLWYNSFGLSPNQCTAARTLILDMCSETKITFSMRKAAHPLGQNTANCESGRFQFFVYESLEQLRMRKKNVFATKS